MVAGDAELLVAGRVREADEVVGALAQDDELARGVVAEDLRCLAPPFGGGLDRGGDLLRGGRRGVGGRSEEAS